MTTARSLLVDPHTPGVYHCISRCVRRAWLCGMDPYNGKSYEHRREWVEQRLLELAEIFAVGIHAYAVMSNHVHVVQRIDPPTAVAWSPEEVASRWVRLFPAMRDSEVDEAACRQKEETLLSNADRLAVCRQRLGSLAWFMRSLNEPIARRANREDACTGRFWEGRYKCQALLDDAAVLTCMSYVDLNPIRAGIAENLESSIHTSANYRIAGLREHPERAQRDYGTSKMMATQRNYGTSKNDGNTWVSPFGLRSVRDLEGASIYVPDVARDRGRTGALRHNAALCKDSGVLSQG
ncbi:transposase [Dokdonella immobilis]|uniref:Transposase IS200-like domain-containing protein n=1 Tax=Dokdonella immobilis TaxID=578942 RepID=A0A1I5AXN3_9GAMM|nr:transposase [Dokdonella immobilis]SFN67160.1 hypothetical protein SAMN05216289_14514 [Dokdonella immobilis]